MAKKAKSRDVRRKKGSSEPKESTRSLFSQTEFPSTTLQEAQRVAAGLIEHFGGHQTSPPDVAMALGISPTSSAWRLLGGSSIAYGLTDGSYNAPVIALTALGRRLVAPEIEGDDLTARREALLKPRIMREFFEQYRRAKFPGDAVGINVLRKMGVPEIKLAAALETLKANGRYAGVIRELPSGLFVHLDTPVVPLPAVTQATGGVTESAELGDSEDVQTGVTLTALAPEPATPPRVTATAASSGDPAKVFISHGKQREIVTQLKELLAFGQFEPMVSVERESTAIPVPEKVFEDMRACGAGVIHVGIEGEYLDANGDKYQKLNDNVLIEIGAAMALYGKRIVLLVEKGVKLPSNLQGLYRCDFEGTRLDYEATMKLLKTFSQFR